jgi:hypothetical protein
MSALPFKNPANRDVSKGAILDEFFLGQRLPPRRPARLVFAISPHLTQRCLAPRARAPWRRSGARASDRRSTWHDANKVYRVIFTVAGTIRALVCGIDRGGAKVSMISNVALESCRGKVAPHACDDSRDVVVPTMLIGLGDELLACAIKTLRSEKFNANLLVGQGTRQSIRAEQETIPVS